MSQFYGDTFEMETAAEAVLLSFSANRGESMARRYLKKGSGH
jgi:hypothetical protein